MDGTKKFPFRHGTVKECGNCESSQDEIGNPPSIQCEGCGACLYCSIECKQQHEEAHKKECEALSQLTKAIGQCKVAIKSSELIGKAMALEPIPTPSDSGLYATGIFIATDRDIELSKEHKFTDIPISFLVGFPLCLLELRIEDSPVADVYNCYVNALGLNPFPQSSNFGECLWKRKPVGTFLVVRRDRGPVHLNHLEALVDFCLNAGRQIQKEGERTGEKFDKTEFAKEKLSPTAFKKHFEDRKKIDLADETRADLWDGVEFPGSVDTDDEEGEE